MKRAWPGVVMLSFLLTFVLPGAAFAHVTVSPEEVQPGATQEFTVLVPTEKDIPTTGASLEIPEGFEVLDVSSPSGGWRGEVNEGSVAWSGGEIGAGDMEITSPEGEVIPMDESQEFTFRARAPEDPGTYAWPVSQTYKDGSVVRWAGPTDSEEPALAVQVAATGPESTNSGGTGHHDPGAGDHEHAADGRQNAAAPTGGSPAGSPTSSYVLLGVGVLAASAATAGLAVLRGNGRTSGTTGRRRRS